MPDTPCSRFYMADLMMGTLLCGLVVALFMGGRGAGEASWMFLAIVVVGSMWASFRANRRAPTCEDCGRRFIPPESEMPWMPTECPQCGRVQERRAKTIRRWREIWRVLLAAFFGSWGVAAIMSAGLLGPATDDLLGLISVGFPVSVLALVGVSVYRRRLERPRAWPCDWCGDLIPLKAAGPSICPQCRLRHLPPEEARRVNRNNAIKGYWFLALLAFLAAFMLWGDGWRGFFGPSPWIGVLAAAVVIFVGFVAALVLLVLAVNLRRRLQLRGERGTLSLARRAAGREGDVIRDGAWTIWYSGQKLVSGRNWGRNWCQFAL